MENKDLPALLIIDMVRDYFKKGKNYPITHHAKKIIGPINETIGQFRERDWPIVFSTDAFNENDFIFKGRMSPHSIAGTPGAEVVDELDKQPQDYWLPKPRFSAFFKTGLEVWLRQRGVTLCVVAGIATNFCVLATALDALCHDFKTVILEDCSAAASETLHQKTLELYRNNPLFPLFQVMDSRELLNSLS